MTAQVVVVGSINIDLVFSAPRLPGAGETVSGASFAAYPGGKGGNQAVATARMGVNTALVGCVGQDSYGQHLLDNLAEDNVDCAHVTRFPDPSGCAGIVVDPHGENTITVAGGANARLTPNLVRQAASHIADAGAMLIQLEIPWDSVQEALSLARQSGIITILDPAPADKLQPESLKQVDYITPNAREASFLTGTHVHCWSSAAQAARELRRWGVGHVLITMGQYGAFYSSQEGEVRITSPQVQAVDSTAAGDAFNGALAAALVQGADPDQAADVAAAAGALAATRPGAQPSLPNLSQLRTVVELPW